ncbi:Oidioi.mRNA.OKI2018_I69.PAR.g11231.t1.cds [Oikopleura dioica]|uniref:Oidioi.mRNA.OKI2018_I69.PAR.g11231.t1.cds n=1 Tax=Oikopleura dioica TaxID=34765 RepID=A0ABN7S162_OIKDI|nr:Oidioi.mRNA.OKI2018_I69.PAR.g11231.t1.cds [Oikopleura dioica]
MLEKAKRMFFSRDKMRKRVERRTIRIELEATIDGSRTATLTVDPRWTVKTVLLEICRVPDLEIRQNYIFGLAKEKDGELYFLQKDKAIGDEAPKGWKDGKDPKPFDVHLKVQFFVVHPEMQLLDAGSRRYYYLSIKNKLAKKRFISFLKVLLSTFHSFFLN